MVDDEAEFLEVAVEVLRSIGFEIVTANDGPRALGLIRDGLKPDAILLDYRMPGLTGLEVLRELRATGCKAPAALVSAIQANELATIAHEFDGSLRKPFLVHELIELLDRLMQGPGDQQHSTRAEVST